MVGTDVARISALVQPQLVGKHYMTYSQELSLLIFILLVVVSMGGAIMWAVVKTEKKLRGRWHKARRQVKLGDVKEKRSDSS